MLANSVYSLASGRLRQMWSFKLLRLVALAFACWTGTFCKASRIDDAYLLPDVVPTGGACGAFVESSATADGERTLASPHYPDRYPNSTRCVRLLRAPSSGQRVVLKFIAFDLEGSRKCLYDSLQLRDGFYGFSPEIARLCGGALPPTVRSSGQYLLAVFTSDEHITKGGFLARYEYEPIRQDEGLWLGDPCYTEVLLQGVQGETVIDRMAVAKHFHNYSGHKQAISCVWDIRSGKINSMVLMWIRKVLQPRVSECRDRCIQIYAPKMATKLFDIDTPVSSACYQGEDRVYPGTSRLLLRICVKSLELLPQIEFNHTLYAPALPGGTCPEGSFDCEDGRVCVTRELLCNGYENCPSGLDESSKYCSIRHMHENKWLQLIFLVAALCGLLFVTGVLAFAATRRYREGRTMSLRALGGGDGAAAGQRLRRRSSEEGGASEDGGQGRAIVAAGPGDRDEDEQPARAADKRRAAFYGSWIKSSVDSSHAA